MDGMVSGRQIVSGRSKVITCGSLPHLPSVSGDHRRSGYGKASLMAVDSCAEQPTVPRDASACHMEGCVTVHHKDSASRHVGLVPGDLAACHGEGAVFHIDSGAVIRSPVAGDRTAFQGQPAMRYIDSAAVCLSVASGDPASAGGIPYGKIPADDPYDRPVLLCIGIPVPIDGMSVQVDDRIPVADETIVFRTVRFDIIVENDRAALPESFLQAFPGHLAPLGDGRLIIIDLDDLIFFV